MPAADAEFLHPQRTADSIAADHQHHGGAVQYKETTSSMLALYINDLMPTRQTPDTITSAIMKVVECGQK